MRLLRNAQSMHVSLWYCVIAKVCISVFLMPIYNYITCHIAETSKFKEETLPL